MEFPAYVRHSRTHVFLIVAVKVKFINCGNNKLLFFFVV